MKSISIVEFPSNLGLKELKPGHEPGVRNLPEWLRKHQFHYLLGPVAEYRLEPPPYTMNLDKVTGVRNADAIAEYAGKQSDMLQKVIGNETFTVVLGGDCSILIGNMLALKKMGNYALFYLDGHTDFVTPDMSQTGGAAGMDLAIITGYGPEKLTNIDKLKPYVKEEQVWCIGNRYLDEEDYVNTIKETSIHYSDLYQLREKGIEKTTVEFLNMVKSRKLDGFWIHIDVDVLNHNIMPAVDSPQPDGFTYEELSELFLLLLSDKKAAGINITILDPELDPTGEFTVAFTYQLTRLLNIVKTIE
jgi:arginase